MIMVETCEQKTEWDNEVLERNGHPLQLWGWGEVKAAHNWQVERVFVRKDGETIGVAQLLIRLLPKPFNALIYIPRGPVAFEDDRREVLKALADHARKVYGAVVITIEPDWEMMPEDASWKRSKNTILIPRTLVLDLSCSEEELLADMTKKTRQYIRKSGGEVMKVRSVKTKEELDKCLAIYKETAKRAEFSIHEDQYYYDVFDMLGEYSPVFAVFKDEEPIAFLWLAISQATAFELYGGMNDEAAELRANYMLKWQVVRIMKKWGIERYDLNGLLNDGVSTFKQGFASHETMLAGSYDKPLSLFYGVWTRTLPIAKKAIRKLKNR